MRSRQTDSAEKMLLVFRCSKYLPVLHLSKSNGFWITSNAAHTCSWKTKIGKKLTIAHKNLFCCKGNSMTQSTCVMPEQFFFYARMCENIFRNASYFTKSGRY